MKGNNIYPMTVTSAYDMLTRFELVYPRSNHNKHMGDKGNRENSGVCYGRKHTFIQHTAPLGTFFIPGLNIHTSYSIECFNCEKWEHYESQQPEPMREGTPNNPGKNTAHISRCLAQGSSGGEGINNWLLLESCSTSSCAKNNSIVSDITVITPE